LGQFPHAVEERVLAFAVMNPSPAVFTPSSLLWHVRSLLALMWHLLCLGGDEPTLKRSPINPGSGRNDLQASVHCPPGEAVRPVIIFIHGAH